MKKMSGASMFAVALLLAACGGEDGNGTAGGTNAQAPLSQVPAPNDGNWAEVVSQTPEGGYLMGNPNAPVKLVEFASMTCPHCAAFSRDASERLRDHYVRSGQVSFEFRNFILNAPDAAASVLARCMPPSAFFRVTEQLFEQQDDWFDNLDEAEGAQISAMPQNQQIAALARAMDLDAFFRQRGMPEGRVSQCLADPQAAQRLADMTRRASEEHGISGTPSFLINGERANGSTWAEIEPLLRQRIGG